MNRLTAQELDQFRLIVESARREGWIDAPSELAVEPSEAGIAVRMSANHGSKVVQKTYPTEGGRWAFQLLRDLAWGSFRR
jgi:hypothetical protein